MTKPQLYVEVSGHGEPVVFFHGMVGSHRYWTRLRPLLSKNHQLIMPDLFGFGLSPRPKTGHYSYDEHLDYLHQAIVKQLSRPFSLVGHSMGALLALCYATRWPDSVKRLILISLPYYKSPAEARKYIVDSTHMPRSMLYGWSAALTCKTVCQFHPISKRISRKLHPEFPLEIADDSMLHNWYSYSKSMTNIIERQAVAADITKLKIPISIIYGTQDKSVNSQSLRELKSSQVTLNACDCGHNIALERPELIANLINKNS